MGYKYISLTELNSYLPDIRKNKVSTVARSPRGFIPAYRRAKGKKENLSNHWQVKREGFVARHLAQYKKNPTPRRKLALIAWAYKP